MESPVENTQNYCTMYLVRHGETDWNIASRAQGQTDVPLNERGILQAREAAKRFKSIHFDAFFSSDLLRARVTAEIIAVEHKLAVTAHKALRERRFGRLEGRGMREFRKIFKKYERLTDEEFRKVRFVEDAETDEEVMLRTITYLREIAIAYPGKTVLMGTHGGVLHMLLLRLGYFATRQESRHTKIGNTAHVKLLSDGVDFFVQEVWGIEKHY